MPRECYTTSKFGMKTMNINIRYCSPVPRPLLASFSWEWPWDDAKRLRLFLDEGMAYMKCDFVSGCPEDKYMLLHE